MLYPRTPLSELPGAPVKPSSSPFCKSPTSPFMPWSARARSGWLRIRPFQISPTWRFTRGDISNIPDDWTCIAYPCSAIFSCVATNKNFDRACSCSRTLQVASFKSLARIIVMSSAVIKWQFIPRHPEWYGNYFTFPLATYMPISKQSRQVLSAPPDLADGHIYSARWTCPWCTLRPHGQQGGSTFLKLCGSACRIYRNCELRW